MKTLKFAPELVSFVLSGKKTCTWRMFDEKDFQVNTNEDEINDGHERFDSHQVRLETYKGYYGDRVTLDSPVKILTFKLTTVRGSEE